MVGKTPLEHLEWVGPSAKLLVRQMPNSVFSSSSFALQSLKDMKSRRLASGNSSTNFDRVSSRLFPLEYKYYVMMYQMKVQKFAIRPGGINAQWQN